MSPTRRSSVPDPRERQGGPLNDINDINDWPEVTGRPSCTGSRTDFNRLDHQWSSDHVLGSFNTKVSENCRRDFGKGHPTLDLTISTSAKPQSTITVMSTAPHGVNPVEQLAEKACTAIRWAPNVEIISREFNEPTFCEQRPAGLLHFEDLLIPCVETK